MVYGVRGYLFVTPHFAVVKLWLSMFDGEVRASNRIQCFGIVARKNVTKLAHLRDAGAVQCIYSCINFILICWKDCHYRKVLLDAWTKGSYASIAFRFVNSLIHGIITGLVIHLGYFECGIWGEIRNCSNLSKFYFSCLAHGIWKKELETKVSRFLGPTNLGE